MARKSQTVEQPEEPQLLVPLAEAEAAIDARLQSGQEILEASSRVSHVQELDELRAKTYTWHEYNETMLRRLLGQGIDTEYRSHVAFGSSDPAHQLKDLQVDIRHYLRQLQSIRDRLGLWNQTPDKLPNVPHPDRQRHGPIFIVHGSDVSRANEVARVIERSTSMDAVILHEQANQGRTLIEKFESHAQDASFAVVLLTHDDEGGRRGDGELRPRGRQNAIFEMGFFFALLGRQRVAVLVEPQVERPSDVDGLVYIDVGNPRWKHDLMREIAATGATVDYTRIP